MTVVLELDLVVDHASSDEEVLAELPARLLLRRGAGVRGLSGCSAWTPEGFVREALALHPGPHPSARPLRDALCMMHLTTGSVVAKLSSWLTARGATG